MVNSLCDELQLLYQPTSAEIEALYSSLIVNCILNVVLSLTAITFNGVTIQALRRTSSLPKPLKTLLLSLAVSDLGVGFLCQPFYVVLLVKWLQGSSASTCTLYTVFVNAMGLFSAPTFFGIMALSVDRFLAIHLHLRYHELVTPKRAVAAVISIWALSASFSLARLWIPKNVFFVLFIVIVLFCLLTTTLLYCKIYIAVRHHREQIEALQVQQGTQNDEMVNPARLRKSAVGTFYVYLVFLVCYLPQTFRHIAVVVSGSSLVTKALTYYCWTLVFLNSSLNPVIYCWKMKHIRRAAMDILRCNVPSHS